MRGEQGVIRAAQALHRIGPVSRGQVPRSHATIRSGSRPSARACHTPELHVECGVLIGLTALDMVQARRSQQKETPIEKAEGIEKEDVGIMPLGVPMLAGPGAISTVMVLAGTSKSPVTTAGLYGAIALTALLSYVTLAGAMRVEQRLGQTGMRILTRLMGLVLSAIAVQFIVDGIKMAGL